MSIRPLHDRVVIKRVETEAVSAGGIVLPDSATDKPNKGEVLAVGPGKPLDNGEVRAPSVAVGDSVLFTQYGSTEVKDGDDTVLVMREDDILAIVD